MDTIRIGFIQVGDNLFGPFLLLQKQGQLKIGQFDRQGVRGRLAQLFHLVGERLPLRIVGFQVALLQKLHFNLDIQQSGIQAGRIELLGGLHLFGGFGPFARPGEHLGIAPAGQIGIGLVGGQGSQLLEGIRQVADPFQGIRQLQAQRRGGISQLQGLLPGLNGLIVLILQGGIDPVKVGQEGREHLFFPQHFHIGDGRFPLIGLEQQFNGYGQKVPFQAAQRFGPFPGNAGYFLVGTGTAGILSPEDPYLQVVGFFRL
ncbi:MAG: hypothetical protein BWY71_02142 [Planctomycetes bacterium ADurb.Bin412]|nr:MAG: hypothetical protein BWY71_02142 [Planctomycetes bacterium ADurb.Bin412]